MIDTMPIDTTPAGSAPRGPSTTGQTACRAGAGASRLRWPATLGGLALALVLGLAGCKTAPPVPPSATLARIQAEMREGTAAASRAALIPPSAVEQALLPPPRLEPARPQPASEPRFDLAVSNAPASQVFLQIVTGSRYSMLVPNDLTGTVAVNLKSVTVREALDALRDLYGYEYRMQGTRIFIQPNTLQTRIFQVNYLAGKRQGATDTRVTSGSISNANSPGGSTGSGNGSTTTGGSTTSSVQSSRIATESSTDFWTDLAASLTAIVGTEGNRKVIVNPLSGVVAVRGFPADLRNAESYMRMTQLIIERQVMIEAKIIEVSLSDGYAAGVNWSALTGGSSSQLLAIQGASGASLAPGQLVDAAAAAAAATSPLLGTITSTDLSALATGGIFGLAFRTPNFAALLQFLETQGNVQVLSSPRIATINNQKAVLKVGTDEFFVTSISTSTTSSGSSTVSSPSIGVQPFFSGIALDVTPQIDDADGVILHLHPSVSVVVEKTKNVNLGSLGRFQLPLAASTVNESDSVVRVQDGNIVAIGGLMKQEHDDNTSGLPGASEVPYAGTLFGQKTRTNTKSELVILLKPTIIRGERGWQSDMTEVQERLQSYEPAAAAVRR